MPRTDENTHRIVFTEKDAASLSKILPVFSDRNNAHGGALLSSAEDNRLVVSGRQTGEDTISHIELSGGSHCTASMKVGVNAIYLLDALRAGFRTFEVIDAMSPLKATNEMGGLHVLMPVKLGDETEPTDGPAAKAPAAMREGERVMEPVTNDAGTARNIKQKGRTNMTTAQETSEGATFEKLGTIAETLKAKTREIQGLLVELAGAVKDTARETKSHAREVEFARQTLAKLQKIDL